MEIRLQKFLAMAGIASRRACEKLILEGRVQVNGKTVRELGVKVDPALDEVRVDGNVCRLNNKPIYILMNKPKGILTTVKDPFGRPTVIDLLKGVRERVFPVGRLDKDTEGLLILTNDGELSYRLTHPKHEIEKTYVAKVVGTPDESDFIRLRRGIVLEDGRTAPAKVRILKAGRDFTVLEIIIHEGRKRQVRRMCKAIGHPVISLKRTRIGKLNLRGLAPGCWRYMTEAEIKYLKNL
ncbi:pseudouridine synthase [Thermosediminibacter oceani]|uniref:Pseudouridine synthase n=1 Tax=Thermosediminibacter oceani (strain ATCC BAA-1034 / DSM 16646 / JW/IW-1228P) TaxID=555079 RepID=D9S3D2_THEOJ|nr:pseudouridine synthase [Thermosediminibacter oceani]ADL07909.1 ribosomal large subunit pseudouridine synthase B [Thermosediminibacter oceani DSM 16646]